MTVEELTKLLTVPEGGTLDIANVIKLLKFKDPIDLTEFRKQYNPSGHDTMDTVKRPDKQIRKPDPTDETQTRTIAGIVKVNRLSLSLQKLITSRAVSFLFGSPVKIISEAKSDAEKLIVSALNRILYDNKISSFNRRIAREMFRSTEVAECWFPVTKKQEHNDYGFKTPFKIKCMTFRRWDGNELYPLFDDTGDLIAFSRAYCRIDVDNKKTNYFETYTADVKLVWSDGGTAGGGWKEIHSEPNTIGKIPVIYGSQEQVEWADVQTAIERLETLLSNFADTNDYHAAPKIFVEGKLTGFAQKGESGAILQGETGTKASYLSWNHATDAVKLEIETLLRFVYSFTQTPDISFESVKGLNQISGEALKMLFLDAHLKVQDKREVFDEYLQRRVNIIKAYIGTINTSLKEVSSTLQIEAEVQPFIINDIKAVIDQLSEATGGKQILSQKTAVALSGLVDKADEEYTQIQKEEQEAKAFEVTQPTF